MVDLGLVNLPTAFSTKFIFHLETKLSKLFESKAKLPNKAAGGAADLPRTDPDANVYLAQHLTYNTNYLN